MLIPIPPPIFSSAFGAMERTLAPSFRALTILRESFASGRQAEFAVKVWEKAHTTEPFKLAGRTLVWVYERLKDLPPDKDASGNARS